jgi:hypothetical protein
LSTVARDALRFWGTFGEIELSRPDAREADPLAVSRAIAELPGWMGDPGVRGRLARFARDVGIPVGPPSDEQLRAALEDALARGSLVARPIERRRVIMQLADSAPPPALGPEDATTDWIGVKLVDADGNPVPDARYAITCSDGSVVEGSLDGRGRARVDGIPAGSCTVSFPEIDAAEYQAV